MPRLRRPFGGAEIAAWILDAPNSACDEAELDRIAASDEDDWDCRRRCFRRKRRDRTAARGNDRDPGIDQP